MYHYVLNVHNNLYCMLLQGNSQYLEANIGRVQDSTTNKRVQLKIPLRIRITKDKSCKTSFSQSAGKEMGS